MSCTSVICSISLTFILYLFSLSLSLSTCTYTHTHTCNIYIRSARTPLLVFLRLTLPQMQEVRGSYVALRALGGRGGGVGAKPLLSFIFITAEEGREGERRGESRGEREKEKEKEKEKATGREPLSST